MAKITGIGGVFFKAKTDNKALREWYQKHLGLELAEWGGAAIRWPDDKAEDEGVTAWHVADPTSKWFSPSESSFMINYRIDNMDEMVEFGICLLENGERGVFRHFAIEFY